MNHRMLIGSLAAVLLSGCGHFRYVATSETQPIGGVQTQGRYRLFQFCVNQNGQYVSLNGPSYASVWSVFKSTVPNVFSDDGKPIAVYLDYTDGRDTKYKWTFLFPYMLTLGTLPMWDHEEWRSHYSIRFKKPKKVSGELRNSFTVKMERDWNMNVYGPIALCCPYETPSPNAEGQPFCHKQTHVLGDADQSAVSVVINSAIAYGAACALKKMEEDGTLPDVWEEGESEPSVNVNWQQALPSENRGGSSSVGNGPGVVEIDSIPL